eukprot:m.191909 g.191909  ORF g.191909 m.191909 type:complete len:220 (-) comp53645_c0_seq5:160-819(-)
MALLLGGAGLLAAAGSYLFYENRKKDLLHHVRELTSAEKRELATYVPSWKKEFGFVYVTPKPYSFQLNLYATARQGSYRLKPAHNTEPVASTITVTIPAGFLTDGASAFFAWDALGESGWLKHDWLYNCPKTSDLSEALVWGQENPASPTLTCVRISRAECDRVLGLPWRVVGLQVFGGFAFPVGGEQGRVKLLIDGQAYRLQFDEHGHHPIECQKKDN